jgi:hypothetical protein
MNTSFLVGAIALALALAGSANAQATAPPTAAQATAPFALFQKLCITPRAGATAVAAAAQAAGFQDPPADLKARFVQDIAGAKLEGADVRVLASATGGSPQVLVFGAKQAAQGDPFPVAVRLSLCFLITPKDAAAEKALADWAAVPADQTVADATAFDFVGDRPHQPITALSAADAAAAAKRGELQVAATQEQGAVALLIYGRNQP